jgi:putative ribosome biogenesis GTPase RsgA
MVENLMAYEYSDLLHRSKEWAKKANQQDWITSQQRDALDSADMAQFAQEMLSRPMLIAFMGGTGVGKSSLLNRLAGRAIAKSGIARPTSREVTVFHHRDVTLPSLPLRGVTVSNHDGMD